MKKVILVLLCLSFFTAIVYSADASLETKEATETAEALDAAETVEADDAAATASADTEESEEADDFDDFDSIFEDAEDVEVSEEEEKKNESPVQIVASAFSSMVHFSGNFKGEVGFAYIKNDSNGQEDKPTGYFTLSNSLNMTIAPSNIFVVHGTLDTGISNGFALSVSSLYFDYLFLDHLYITAGKKSISWGNLRLFNNSTYYNNAAYDGSPTHSGGLFCTGTRYVDIWSEDGAQYSLQLRYPWTFGTVTFATTGNTTTALEPDSVNYYGSIEVSLFNTNINLYAKFPELASAKDPVTKIVDPEKKKNNIFVLELKRTILGFDVYGQGLARIRDFSNFNHSTGYDYIVGTVGLYRLWDAFDPNIGFNIEYQHEFHPIKEVTTTAGTAAATATAATTANKKRNFDRIAFEGGVKRIGKNKNIKVGVISHYSITEKHGFTGLTFVVSGICPYAEWTNNFAFGYGEKYQSPIYVFNSAITLSLDY